MKQHFASVEAAKCHVDPYLDSWVTYYELRGQGGFNFRYRTAKVVDREPLPPGSGQTVELSGISTTATMGTARLHVRQSSYPAPPSSFVADPDVQTMWMRHKGYKQGKEPITTMGYFCYTVVKLACGNELSRVSSRLKVSRPVLRKLCQLTTEYGGPSEARKREAPTYKPLTGEQRTWIDKVVRELVERLGRVRAGDQGIPPLTMDRLPQLLQDA